MTQIKICGITNIEDALAAVAYGADALGFIFYPASPRYIKPDNVQKIIRLLPDQVVKVGVFVNEKAAEIKKIMEYCSLDIIQLQGDETPAYCQIFPAQQLIKAVELKSEADLLRAESYNVSAILVDSRHAGLYGGTGRKANWELARRLKHKKPLILAGGLNQDNIGQAIKEVAPPALDICSGVELVPGKKDHAKLARIFDIVRRTNTGQKETDLIFTKRGK
ncbi:MAG: phosphoribosylanthranilate isomerase [Deltaproteobacteria bacterium HGW-Deltaproteobacteria-9]|nr:MAG: phosphoribosylanthranilate isomerase [Deltaproteobacteria bacterium HGW-Deltaproteobacteria-9]